MKKINYFTRLAFAGVALFATLLTLKPLNQNIGNNTEIKTNESKNQKVVKKLNSNEDEQEKESLSTKEDQYLEPVYGDYELGTSFLRTSEHTKDEYESNNSFSTATLLSSKPLTRPYDYGFSIDATLHIDPWWNLFWRDIDEDYYRFDVYAQANVTIGMKNIASGLDYDLELYMHNNVRYASKDSVTRVGRSIRSGNTSESITKELSPGTYYARIYSYEGHSAWSEYNFYGSITYINDLSATTGKTSISDLRYNKGAGAAIWMSDLDPYGIKPLETYKKELVGQTVIDLSGSMYPINTYSHENPFYANLPLNQSIPQAILYIWDLNLRTEVYNALSLLENKILAEIATNKETKMKIETWENIVDGVLTLAGIIITLSPIKSVTISLTIAIGIEGLSLLAGAIFKTLLAKDWTTSRDNLVNHIRVIKAALECDSNTSSNEVVRIPITYKLVSEHPFAIYSYIENNYVDYSPEYSTNGYLYNEATISNFQSNGVFGGSVYGVKNYGDILSAFNRHKTILEDTNTGGNTTISLGNTVVENLNKGEYRWYNFTAPMTGEYTFYTEGNTDTYGEMFNNIVPALSINGRVQYDDDSGVGLNFSISRTMNVNEKIYLRVRGYSSATVGMYSIKVQQTNVYVPTIKTIRPIDYGYGEVYYFDAKTKTITLSDGFSFQTNRLRTGFISNNYLTLSAKRKDAGLAYHEYYFNESIFEIDFGIALWSENEALNSAESSIMLQYLSPNGIWQTGINFNASTLPKSKDTLQQFEYTFSTPVKGFRFIVTTNAVNNDNNRGRVVIGDINIHY